MKKLVLWMGMTMFALVCSTFPNAADADIQEHQDTVFALKEAGAAKSHIDKLLPRSGHKGVQTGIVKDFGGFFIVTIVDAKNPKIIRNEMVVRKDSAVLPVYGAHFAGRPVRMRIDTANKARSHARIWLWKTKQDSFIVSGITKSEFTFVVNLSKKNNPREYANQLLIRKDGYILPVGNGQSMTPLLSSKTKAYSGFSGCIGCDDLPIFDSFLNDYDDPWGSWGSPGGYNDWDSGWFGSGWGWGWGSGGSWKPHDDSDDDCDGMDDQQCWCLIRCRDVCRGLDPTENCFENCIDRCVN